MSTQMDSRNGWRYIGVASAAICAISLTACLYRTTVIDSILQRVQRSVRDIQSEVNETKERLARLESAIVEEVNGKRRPNMTRSLPAAGGVRSDDEEFYDFSEV